MQVQRSRHRAGEKTEDYKRCEALAEKENKQLCRRFFHTGTCSYGKNCAHHHARGGE